MSANMPLISDPALQRRLLAQAHQQLAKEQQQPQPAKPLRSYGWDAVKLSEAYSLEQLEQLRQSVIQNPDNQNPDHKAGKSIFLYTKSARRKLEALGWAVFFRLGEADQAKAGANG